MSCLTLMVDDGENVDEADDLDHEGGHVGHVRLIGHRHVTILANHFVDFRLDLPLNTCGGYSNKIVSYGMQPGSRHASGRTCTSGLSIAYMRPHRMTVVVVSMPAIQKSAQTQFSCSILKMVCLRWALRIPVSVSRRRSSDLRKKLVVLLLHLVVVGVDEVRWRTIRIVALQDLLHFAIDELVVLKSSKS